MQSADARLAVIGQLATKGCWVLDPFDKMPDYVIFRGRTCPPDVYVVLG